MAKKTLFIPYPALIVGGVVIILILWLIFKKPTSSAGTTTAGVGGGGGGGAWHRYHWIGCNGCITEGISEQTVSTHREGWAGMHAKHDDYLYKVKVGDRIEVKDDAGWSGTYNVKGIGPECETTAGVTSPTQQKYPNLIVFDKVWFCSKHPTGKANLGGQGGEYRIV
tara:strand:- start:767 stop:1267 length:501 start_codon:yes stop_codon:yes gene_type:complete